MINSLQPEYHLPFYLELRTFDHRATLTVLERNLGCRKVTTHSRGRTLKSTQETTRGYQEVFSYQQLRQRSITYEEKEKNLADQPNSNGNTLMHTTTNLDDDEATEMLLDHGANLHVQDAEGNSPLHTICSQRDIQTVTSILKSNGNLLSNKKMKTPALAELFFDQDEEEVKKIMSAVDQSNHRTDILNEILRKEHLLFRLIEEDKSEVLSIVLRTLTEAEKETYVNLV